MTKQEHYFSGQPQSPSDPVQFQAEVGGVRLQLVSDTGTFSHGRVDTGSRLLAEKMQLDEASDVLDLGCGWGLLGIVAARKWPGCHVVMVDINERACQLAIRNLELNSVTNADAICGDAPQVLGEQEFDAILCNPPIRAGKREVIRLLEHAVGRLRKGGVLWLVARTSKGAKTLARDIAPLFARVETVARRAGYRVFECRK